MKNLLKKIYKNVYLKYTIFISLIVFIALSAVFAQARHMESRISDISKIYLSKISIQNANMISGQIKGNLQGVNVLARVIGNLENFSEEEIMKIITPESENTRYMAIGVVLNDGSIAFTNIKNKEKSGKTLIRANDLEYINSVIKGYSGLYGNTARILDGEAINLYAVPIFKDYSIEGALVIYYKKEFFHNFIFPQTFAEEGISYIADKNGTKIFMTPKFEEDKNFEEAVNRISSGWQVEDKKGIDLKEQIEKKKSGTVEGFFNDKKMYVSYVPLGFNDWYYISITAVSIADAQSRTIYDNILPSFLYALAVIISIALIYIYVKSQKLKRMENRIMAESIKDESYRMIMEKTNEIIFEYDTAEKKYLHTENFQRTFGYNPSENGFMGSLESDYIHSEDVITYVKAYEKMKKDKTLEEIEVRMINSEGNYIWTKLYLLGLFDNEGKLLKVIGKIVDNDKKKREIEKLKKLAVMDSHAGVYNKQTTETMINEFLSGEGKDGTHAMIIIDIDDFKSINDDYGHRLGDVIISELGIELNKIFRASDIKGRIGGDEFMVLIKDVEGLDFIENKAQTVCQLFSEFKTEDKKDVSVSTSVGIAIYNVDGKNYEELYEAADRALYSCKNIQKGTFAFSNRS